VIVSSRPGPGGQLPALTDQPAGLLAGELAVYCDHPLNESGEATCGYLAIVLCHSDLRYWRALAWVPQIE
jgi:hypothetical protein